MDVNLSVNFLKKLTELVVVYFNNIHSFPLALVSTRKSINEHLLLCFGKLYFETLEHDFKVIKENLIGIVLVCGLLDDLEELVPLCPDLLENLFEDGHALVLVNFLVEAAVVLDALRDLPTLLVLATVNLVHLWFILPEVEPLGWVDLASHCQLEVLVGDFAVAVQVELLEEV